MSMFILLARSALLKYLPNIAAVVVWINNNYQKPSACTGISWTNIKSGRIQNYLLLKLLRLFLCSWFYINFKRISLVDVGQYFWFMVPFEPMWALCDIIALFQSARRCYGSFLNIQSDRRPINHIPLFPITFMSWCRAKSCAATVVYSLLRPLKTTLLSCLSTHQSILKLLLM